MRLDVQNMILPCDPCLNFSNPERDEEKEPPEHIPVHFFEETKSRKAIPWEKSKSPTLYNC